MKAEKRAVLSSRKGLHGWNVLAHHNQGKPIEKQVNATAKTAA
jgi:hypothetical protein